MVCRRLARNRWTPPRRVMWLVWCLLFWAAPVHAQDVPRVVLLTSGEWPPFFSASLPGGGFANRIISESFALEGIEVHFEFLPWRRALETAALGPAMGSAGWLPLADRKKKFLYSDAVFDSSRVFFHRRDFAFDWQNLGDVQGMRVAVTLGSVEEFPFGEILAGGRGKMDIARDYVAGMKMLIAGRVDIYACNKAVGLFILGNRIDKGASDVTYHPRPIFTETNHLIISRRLPFAEALMERFNSGLRMLRQSGRYERIRRDYPELD